MSTGPKTIENRGGYRPGAGRKPDTLPEGEIAKMLKAEKKKAKATGKSIDDILLSIIYGEASDIRPSDRLTAIKIFKEFTIGKRKVTESTIKQPLGPTIYLPAQMPDPAKVIQKKG